MTTLKLTPQSRYIVVGGTGTFAVVASGKQRFDAFQLTVDFDSEVLECTAAAVPAATALIYTSVSEADINNGRGILNFASSGALADVDDLTDSITLLEMTFRAIEPNAGSAISLRTTAAVIHDDPAGGTTLGPKQILPCALAISGQDVLDEVENAAVVTFPMPDVPTALRSSSGRTRNDIIGQAYRKVLGPSRLSGDQIREGADVLNDILREESLRLTRGEKAVWTISRGALFLRVGQVTYGTAEQWIGQDGGMVRRVDSTNQEFAGVGLLPTPIEDLIPATHHGAGNAYAPTTALTAAQTWAQFAGFSADVEELLSAQYRDISGDDSPLRIITQEQYATIGAKTDSGEPECVVFLRSADRAQQQLMLDCASSVGAPDTMPDTVIGSDGNVYTCLIAHTASRYNRPVDGSDWQTFWVRQGLDGDQWVDGTAYTSAPSILYTYRRRILSFDQAGDCPDMPEGWERYLIYRLAYDLGADHGITMEQMQWLKAEYLAAYETLFQSARETQNDHHDKATYF